MNEHERLLQEIVSEEDLKKVFDKVFDNQTIMALHKLARQEYFKEIEFVISSGKEGKVFRAVDNAGNYRAVKLYKTKAVEFRHLRQYIENDLRFKNVKKDHISLIYAWTKKEFKNLERMGTAAGVRVPMPLAFNKNALVMEFIGKNGVAAGRLKENPLNDTEKLKDFFVDSIARMIEKAGLVHADLSEYNVLNNNGELVIIDVGQSVLLSHPKAKEFFERDLSNVANYLEKQGLEVDTESLRKEIEERQKEIK